MDFSTCDLCDEHGDSLQVLEPVLQDFGGHGVFCGEVSTVQVLEDNTAVRSMIETAGKGRVLVVDGGGSLNCALLGDSMAAIAADNGWAGIVINGCVRDVAELEDIDIGIRALSSNPRRSAKRTSGVADVPVTFAGVRFEPGMWLYADEDGVVVSGVPLAGSGLA